ncbi:tropomodulin isoform X2 [Trichogramma pretiosum]|uniref:tropomodulin isoform X2 n=1 Tax=Trichogramma pretiosum TaxID=7493 RepID=UPI0006C991E3|nr:tropomodulin isoform X2 [Trichogramma pretiosum]
MEVMDAVVPDKGEDQEEEDSGGVEIIYDEPTVEVEYDDPVITETDDDITMTTRRRKITRTKYRIQETSSSTKKTTMTTAAKLYGKDLSEYDDVDVDELLSQLTPEEINILAKEVDPDDSFMPPSQRCSYECTKTPTGPLNRKKLIEHINKQALETPDIPEIKPYVPGVVRGKKWIPPVTESLKEKEVNEQIAIDLGDEYEQALSNATEDEIIDLAAILGFHSMMNQDQYHASLLNSGQPLGMGWDGITKASQPKVFPMDPPNDTDVDDTIRRVREDDHLLADVNWNNIKNISDEKFMQLFEAIENNTHLETLSLTNVGLTDKAAQRLADALEKNSTLRVLNVETNFISPPVIVKLVKSLLNTKAIEEFRCSNQRSQVLGNKIEMEITQLVEQNPTLLRLGLHLEFNDARHRVAAHLQRNIDRIKRLKNPEYTVSYTVRQSRLEVATS